MGVLWRSCVGPVRGVLLPGEGFEFFCETFRANLFARLLTAVETSCTLWNGHYRLSGGKYRIQPELSMSRTRKMPLPRNISLLPPIPARASADPIQVL